MKLSDMTDAEKKVLGSLVRVMLGADGESSAAEVAGLAQAAEDLGADEFRRVVKEAGTHALDESEVRAEAQAVARKEAQETIYGALFGIAAAGSIVDAEGRLLDWLAEVWNLERAPLRR